MAAMLHMARIGDYLALDANECRAAGQSLAERYRTAEPFPHIVLDDLFDSADLDIVLREFPAPADMQWMRFDNPLEKKLGYFHERSKISQPIRNFLNEMNSFKMLLWLEALTGIRRAGADIVITYHAKDVAEWLS